MTIDIATVGIFVGAIIGLWLFYATVKEMFL